MISKIPIIAPAATIADILGARAERKDGGRSFSEAMSAFLGPGFRFFPVGSGIAAYLLILRALAETGGRKDVVVPAYTAGSLVTAIREAGLRPVLCDVSLDDFNLDVSQLGQALSGRTLCVTACHLFGIGMNGLGEIQRRYPAGRFYLVEDCAQSMGSLIRGKPAGVFGDIAFFSFNRGKNLPVSGGGCIAVRDSGLAALIGSRVAGLTRRPVSCGEMVRSIAFTVAAAPFVYGPAYPLIRRFKETAPPEEIKVEGMSCFARALAVRLLGKSALLFSSRRESGSYLLKGLSGIPGIRVPVIPEGDHPAFNRVPVIVERVTSLPRLQEELWKAGIESSRMYLRPLHHMFELGYAAGDFPSACFLAEHLLTLPCHPACDRRALDTMIRTIRTWA